MEPDPAASLQQMGFQKSGWSLPSRERRFPYRSQWDGNRHGWPTDGNMDREINSTQTGPPLPLGQAAVPRTLAGQSSVCRMPWLSKDNLCTGEPGWKMVVGKCGYFQLKDVFILNNF